MNKKNRHIIPIRIENSPPQKALASFRAKRDIEEMLVVLSKCHNAAMGLATPSRRANLKGAYPLLCRFDLEPVVFYAN